MLKRLTASHWMSSVFFLLLMWSSTSNAIGQGWIDGNPPTYNGILVQGQCVEFVDDYAKNVIGCSLQGIDTYHPFNNHFGDAEAINSDGAHWIWDDPKNCGPANTDRIPNNGVNLPQSQDIMVWSSSVGSGYGHVAIVYSVKDSSHVTVVDANWHSANEPALKGKKHSISIKSKDTSGNYMVLGWYRKKGATVSDTDLYVDGQASGQGDGTVNSPFQTIGAAINRADPTKSVTIHVKGGSYPETINIRQNIRILNNGGGAVHIGG